jgi:hypothetical protein
MKWVYRLERRLGRGFGVSNLMIYVTSTLAAVYLLWLIIMPGLPLLLNLTRFQVLQGQIWRLVTFLAVPPLSGNVLLVLLGFYCTYHLGTSLEYAWGKSLFTIYFILGALGAIIAGMLSGYGDNSYLYLSIFLAYCYLYPEATFMIFFILPVKAKYLAIVNWVVYLYAFVMGNFSSRLAIVFSLANFFIFFGPQVLRTMKQNQQQSKRRREYRRNWGRGSDWR